jgi:hypothetical protein
MRAVHMTAIHSGGTSDGVTTAPYPVSNVPNDYVCASYCANTVRRGSLRGYHFH